VGVRALRSDECEVNAALSRELTRGAEQPPSYPHSLVLLAHRHIVDKEFGRFAVRHRQRLGGDATGQLITDERRDCPEIIANE